MPFIKQKFHIKTPIKAMKFLQNELHLSQQQAQKIIDKKRLFMEGNIIASKTSRIAGEIEILSFEARDLGIKPIFTTRDWAIFDKPAGLLSHPKGQFYHESLLDCVKFIFGKNANIINRLDAQTSGLILASRNKQSEIKLKMAFQHLEIQKCYLALVHGKIESGMIDLALKSQSKNQNLGIRQIIDESGKNAQTKIEFIAYFKHKNISLIKAYPLTGRTHQIRAHLAHIGHRIVGECLYGIDDNLASDFLDGNIRNYKQAFGAKRLMLHSSEIKFSYDLARFHIVSKATFDF